MTREKTKRYRQYKSKKKGSAFSAKYVGTVCVLLSLILFGAWKIWQSDYIQMRFVYMWPYQNEIVSYSQKNNIDPFLVAAIVKNESHFNRRAVSKVGAIGLMQIMPDTGEWISKQMGLKDFTKAELYDPETNIRMGAWYVSELEYEFQKNLVLALIAYNAGRGQTKEWMEKNGWDYNFGTIKDIPYNDTKNYVKSVLEDRDEYYRLYKKHLTTL